MKQIDIIIKNLNEKVTTPIKCADASGSWYKASRNSLYGFCMALATCIHELRDQCKQKDEFIDRLLKVIENGNNFRTKETPTEWYGSGDIPENGQNNCEGDGMHISRVSSSGNEENRTS